MINIITKEKYQGEGRIFGDGNNLLKQLVVLLSNDGNLPNDYTDVEGLEECAFAPGSLLFDTDGGKKYMYDGSSWIEWN